MLIVYFVQKLINNPTYLIGFIPVLLEEYFIVRWGESAHR